MSTKECGTQQPAYLHSSNNVAERTGETGSICKIDLDEILVVQYKCNKQHKHNREDFPYDT